MKAVVYSEYGKPDVLLLKEVDKPIPRDNEILVKVFFASVNDWDWQLLQGIPFINRLDNGFRKPKKYKILGCDIAGRIESVGSKVMKYKPGDEVYGDLCASGFGGFAEYACASENALTLKPSEMTFEEAAAIPQAGMLAVQGLRGKGQLKSGKKLLVNGAGGGVGTFAVQIAKLYNVEVTGVDSAGKLDLMRSIGFDHVIDYTKTDFTRNYERYDLILDNKMNRPISDYLRVLSASGTCVITGGTSARLIQVFLLGPLISIVSRKRIGVLMLKPNKDLDYINQLFKAGQIKPVLDDRIYKLNEVPEAIGRFGKGEHKGKIVIKVQS